MTRWVRPHRPPTPGSPRTPPASCLAGAPPAPPAPLLPGSPGCGAGVSLLPLPLTPARPGAETPPAPGSPSSAGVFAGGSHALGRAEGRERRQGGGVSTAQRGLIPPHSSHQCVVPLNPREPPSREALLHFAEHELMRKKILVGRGEP